MSENPVGANSRCGLPGACGEASRREFFQKGCSAVAVALFGLTAADGAALPVFMTSGAGPANDKRFPLPAADSVSVDRSSQVILVRFQNHIFAFALSCPHENAAVKWLAKDRRFQCTKHDSEYQPDGLHTAGRATRNLDRFALRREGNEVVVNLRLWFQSDKDPAGWAAALIQL